MAEEIRTHYKHKMIKPPTTKYEENMFAGGFFILHKLFINLFTKLYNEKLQYYFLNNYLIKDDQTIVQDIIFTNQDLFEIHNENNDDYDNWFMFQRILRPFTFHDMIDANKEGQTSVIKPRIREEMSSVRLFTKK